MNPKRQFRQLRSDDRWIGLPQTSSPTPKPPTAHPSRRRAPRVMTAVAFLIAAVIAVGLWAGLSGLHHAGPASLSPLPSSTLHPRPTITLPCADPARLAPIGCSTYTATAAAGVPGGASTWAGALPPALTLRVLHGKVTALIDSGCNGLTLPLTLTANTMSPAGSGASTSELCTGARNVQERWVFALFKGPVTYTLADRTLHLTSGSKSLQLVASTVDMTVPTGRTSLPSTPRTVSPSAAGCTPTSAKTPKGAFTSTVADVDGDGRRDLEWSTAKNGDITFGITTASGATISGEQGFAGGGSRSFVVGKLANGVVVAITSEGRDSPVYTFTRCAFHPLRGKDLIPGSSAKSQFTLYSMDGSGSGGCFNGRLALLRFKKSSTDPSGNTQDVTARWVNVSRNGLHATLTTEASTISRDVPVNGSSTKFRRYAGISCGTSTVLYPVAR